MKTGHLVWLAPIFLLQAPGVLAQSSLDARVQKLEDTIQVLERRVAALEDQLRERNAPTAVAPDKVNWRKLQSGMSEGDVEQLLGSPTKIIANQFSITWLYGSPIFKGRVEFDAASHKLESWSEP